MKKKKSDHNTSPKNGSLSSTFSWLRVKESVIAGIIVSVIGLLGAYTIQLYQRADSLTSQITELRMELHNLRTINLQQEGTIQQINSKLEDKVKLLSKILNNRDCHEPTLLAIKNELTDSKRGTE